MGRLRIYFKPIWYNIMHHKAYAGFCVFGTMLTFVFITILLQIVHVLQGNTPPAIYTERMIGIPDDIWDERGNNFDVRWEREEVQMLMGLLQGYENYTCCHDETCNFRINGLLGMNTAVYTDYNYWNVFQFDFIQGHPFTEREAKERWVVVKESVAKTYFTKENVIGEEVYFQGNTYKIIGVVADVSAFATNGTISMWFPEYFDRGVSGNDWVRTFILFPEGTDMDKAKARVANAVNRVAEMKNINVIKLPEHIRTEQETKSRMSGGDLMIGVWEVILLLLVIPVLNIILLSLANTSIQVTELGVKRALGANRNFVFLEILMENGLFVLVGTLLGIILIIPVCQYIDGLLFTSSVIGKLTVLAEINWWVILLEVLPLSLLFSLLSGGLPALGIVRYPIVDMLKGGVK